MEIDRVTIGEDHETDGDKGGKVGGVLGVWLG
jgi:hypothetical protein